MASCAMLRRQIGSTSGTSTAVLLPFFYVVFCVCFFVFDLGTLDSVPV